MDRRVIRQTFDGRDDDRPRAIPNIIQKIGIAINAKVHIAQQSYYYTIIRNLISLWKPWKRYRDGTQMTQYRRGISTYLNNQEINLFLISLIRVFLIISKSFDLMRRNKVDLEDAPGSDAVLDHLEWPPARRTFQFDVAPFQQTLVTINVTALKQRLVFVRIQANGALAIVIEFVGEFVGNFPRDWHQDKDYCAKEYNHKKLE